MTSSITLSFSEIQPYIRYVQRFRVAQEEYPDFFRPYDCRFFFVSKGSGYLYTRESVYRLQRGNVVIWHSGCEYRMVSDEHNLLILLGVNFDFTPKNAHMTIPIPPESTKTFDENKILEQIRFSDMPLMNQVVYLQDMQNLEPSLQDMLLEYDSQKLFCSQRLSGMFLSLLAQCCRTLSLGQRHRSISAQKIDEILTYIHEHYQEDITNIDLGRKFNYHPNYLNKQVSKYTGKSLHQYLLSYRISKAVDMISSTDMTISEIADATGFGDIHHFSKTFRHRTGLSPSEIRSSKQNIVLDI